MITDEKRAFKRVKLRCAVRYKFYNSGEFKTGTAISNNISLGGVYFISIEKLKIGQLIECSIDMPNIKCEGKWTARVVRCDSMEKKMINTFGVAIEFIKSIRGSEKKLQKALSVLK